MRGSQLHTEANPPETLVVLCSHRAGSSVFTRSLQVLGFSPGGNLLPPDDDNQKGYFEDATVVAINSLVLEALGHEWWTAYGLLPIEENLSSLGELRQRATAYIKTLQERNPKLVLKDPRIALVLPFWRLVFADAGINWKAVMVHRDFSQTAESLKDREGFSLEQGRLLWLQHNLSALHLSGNELVDVVGIEALFDDPERTLKKLGAALGGVEIDEPALTEFSTSFLENTLMRRAASASIEVILGREFEEVFQQVQRYLQTFQIDKHRSKSSELPQIWSSWEKAARVFSASDLMSAPQKELNAAVKRATGLQQELKNRNQKIEEASLKFGKLEERFQDTEALLRISEDKLRDTAAKHESTREQLHIFVERLQSSHERHALSQQQSSAKLDEATLSMQIAQAELEAARAVIAEMRASLSWRLTEVPRLVVSTIISAPLRHLVFAFSKPTVGQLLWALIPIRVSTKNLLKERIFTHIFKGVLKNTSVYKAWTLHKEQLTEAEAPSVDIASELDVNFESQSPREDQVIEQDQSPETSQEAQENHEKSPAAFRPIERRDPLVAEREFTYTPDLERALPVFSEESGRVIAFYLPQFHTIPENDDWWGEGFTEWTKVGAAKPVYDGGTHPISPHSSIGFYDLSDPNVMKDQSRLARTYGVDGFLFYFYWFAGKTLLEKPLENLLRNPQINMPFMLCWANENWTRTWDGAAESMLIGQEHSAEDDIAFIKHVSTCFHDQRYIRVDGKPVLVVYRPDLLPNAVETSERWRSWCINEGIGEIYLISSWSYTKDDPRDIAFDAVMEFMPNNSAPDDLPVDPGGLNDDFSGRLFDWLSLASRSQEYSVHHPDFQLFRTITPGWDNTARRPETGTRFVGDNPADFGRWAFNAISDVRARVSNSQERFVFVNAWNEWAEGAVLEPTKEKGFAYLDSLRQAKLDVESPKFLPNLASKGFVLVGHDAEPMGAQRLTLNIAKTLVKDGLSSVILLLEGGPLVPAYEEIAPTLVLGSEKDNLEYIEVLIDTLKQQGYESVIANTSVTGEVAAHFSRSGLRVISLIHERQKIIEDLGLDPSVHAIASNSDAVVFPAEVVKADFCNIASLNPEQVIIRPQGCYATIDFSEGERDELAAELYLTLDIPLDAPLVIGVGYGDFRKGLDTFIDVHDYCQTDGDLSPHFIWIGGWDGVFEERIASLGKSPRERSIHFVGWDNDVRKYFAAANLLFLSSREDPFPSVILEAMSAEIPVLLWEGAGGCSELVHRGVGVACEDYTVEAFSSAILKMLNDPSGSHAQGSIGRQLIESEFSFHAYVRDLVRLAKVQLPTVSVVVPNYNYAHYLVERLRSIESQTYPISEVLILDDASEDESLEIISEWQRKTTLEVRVIANSENSGSPFTQWHKGLNEVSTDLVWIAEADDVAESSFLADVISGMNDAVDLGYSESQQINESGEVLAMSYHDYVQDISFTKWREAYRSEGSEEIVSSLSVKNTIPNVSAVIFRRQAVVDALDRCWSDVEQMRFAGDWRIYLEVLKQGKLFYTPKASNRHRRHTSSRTHDSTDRQQHFDEVVQVQSLVAAQYDLPNSVLELAANWRSHVETYLELKEDSLDISGSSSRGTPITAIAFHLPQFHPIRENDEWWGKGFTEWTNVSKSQSLFEGHAQPRLPADLGFYDLRLPETRLAQAVLAKEHGISAFCYWHYWFEGRRLLERPVEEILKIGEPDFPFCLAWANETWSRRWLGEEQDQLIEQTYSEQDDLAHSKHLTKIFESDLYLRHDGRPVFLVYRPAHHDDVSRFCSILRAQCRETIGVEPFLVAINAHNIAFDGRNFGFDTNLNFAPQLSVLEGAFTDEGTDERLKRNVLQGVEASDIAVYDYADSVQKMRELRASFDYETLPCVFAGWDNTPRRGRSGIVMQNATPEEYQEALQLACDEAAHTNGLVFINAWNEWAEGNYLEPDSVNGSAFLKATSKVLEAE